MMSLSKNSPWRKGLRKIVRVLGVDQVFQSTLIMLTIFINYTPPQFLSCLPAAAAFQLKACF